MKFKTFLILIILILITLFLISCNSQKTESNNITFKNKITISKSLSSDIFLKKVLRLNIDKEDLFLDNFITMKVDANKRQ